MKQGMKRQILLGVFALITGTFGEVTAAKADWVCQPLTSADCSFEQNLIYQVANPTCKSKTGQVITCAVGVKVLQYTCPTGDPRYPVYVPQYITCNENTCTTGCGS